MEDNFPSFSFGRYTAEDLINEKTNESLTIVKNLIPVGVTILAAPPKAGKTFLGLQLCDSISSGKDFLGYKTKKGSTLYLAFEDYKSSISKRLKTMNIEPKSSFVIDVDSGSYSYDLEERIIKEIIKNSDLRIVIIDTFAKIRNNSEHDYENEYKEIAKYHDLAYRYNIAIVLVTHLRKEINTNSPFESVYGSRGITAAADSNIIMYKKKHISKNRQVCIQGKDIEDREFTITQKDDLTFEVIEEEIDEILDDNLSKVINYVVSKGYFEGSHEALCSKLNLVLSARGLQALLRNSHEELSASYITYETLPRTNKARTMRLTYKGDEKV